MGKAGRAARAADAGFWLVRRSAWAVAVCAAVLALAGVAAAQERPPTETLIAIGPARVSELVGPAYAQAAKAPAGTPPRPLQAGSQVADGEQVQTGAATRLELRFADGTLLRVGPTAALTLLSRERRVALHRGRLLISADRMLGGLAVLTRRAAMLPEGTTYLAEVGAAGDELTVLEGAVCACTVAPPASPGSPAPSAAPSAAHPRPEQMVLPGETLLLPATPAAAGPPRTQPIRLAERLASEPLITGFSKPLASLPQLTELIDQQKRGVLAGRNDRLRREIFWKRKPRAPLQLPPLFSEPDSIIIRYVFPP
jgi:hypothetical protein